MESKQSIRMSLTTEIKKIAFLGDYLPAKCGITTFTPPICAERWRMQYPETEKVLSPSVNDLAAKL